jgi:hypothetical protein
MNGPLEASKLTRTICGVASGWDAAERCCGALRATSATTFQGRAVDKGHIERIYTIRLSRPGASSDVVGSDRLLADLASHEGKELTMVVLAGTSDADVYCIFLNQGADHLVSCFVAPDRRMTVV